MKKTPTIFKRDPKNMSRLIDEPHPDCAWVFAGEGRATQKMDGTCCMVRDGKLYKRRELKKGKPEPADFELVEHDQKTGKKVGWVPVTDSPEDKYHREAFDYDGENLPDGTYELLGPKIQGNAESMVRHILISHETDVSTFFRVPVAFSDLPEWLSGHDIEGIVWHHPDGRMAKIKKRDFGLDRASR